MGLIERLAARLKALGDHPDLTPLPRLKGAFKVGLIGLDVASMCRLKPTPAAVDDPFGPDFIVMSTEGRGIACLPEAIGLGEYHECIVHLAPVGEDEVTYDALLKAVEEAQAQGHQIDVLGAEAGAMQHSRAGDGTNGLAVIDIDLDVPIPEAPGYTLSVGEVEPTWPVHFWAFPKDGAPLVFAMLGETV